jgi:hypothetical protein
VIDGIISDYESVIVTPKEGWGREGEGGYCTMHGRTGAPGRAGWVGAGEGG